MTQYLIELETKPGAYYEECHHKYIEARNAREARQKAEKEYPDEIVVAVYRQIREA